MIKVQQQLRCPECRQWIGAIDGKFCYHEGAPPCRGVCPGSRTKAVLSLHGVYAVEQMQRRVVAAWLIDRSSQYEESHPCRAFVDELVRGIIDGEPERAHEHGELDDIMRRLDTARKARGR